ncbi:Lysine-specific permease [Tatumella ptyseos]|uniref:Lysine-specific permease n=1 Tax=Tatumella ptyseos TaxID=82987 RepID=A0A2X5NPR9_9GAMM|nr:Lysine-specific permease [Tatumella ptyseos]
MRQVFWRILLFYVLAILIISLLLPYTDPRLLHNDVKDISVSPFTLVFQNAGLLSAAAVMNAVILTAVLSAGNSGMYASTRMLFTLAQEGKAPKIFARLTANGVPRNALIATTVIAALCFLSSKFGNQTVYMWLLNTSGMTGFIAWLGIAISHYRFRRGYVAKGITWQTCLTVQGSSRSDRCLRLCSALSSHWDRTIRPLWPIPLTGMAWQRPISVFRCSW